AIAFYSLTAGPNSGVHLTSLASNSISNSAAGWTAGELSVAASPTLIRITSGSAIGRTFLVSTTANTATTVTIDASDLGSTNLTSLGILTGDAGDTYELLNAHTLATLFGTDSGNGILTGTNGAACDQVQLMVTGAYRTYYLSSATNPMQWKRLGPNTASSNVVIKPETGILFSRLANSSLALTFTGTVPTIERKVAVKDSGLTNLSTGWSADATISTLGLTSIPTWTSGTASTSDTVQFLVTGAYRTYYFNGTNWRRVGPNTISDSVAIPAGTVYTIKQLGAAATFSTLTQTAPYSL
ncbi:MAG: hypothetical protein WCQ16_11470, partial [Verrucomicrobiae bacterium]